MQTKPDQFTIEANGNQIDVKIEDRHDFEQIGGVDSDDLIRGLVEGLPLIESVEIQKSGDLNNWKLLINERGGKTEDDSQHEYLGTSNITLRFGADPKYAYILKFHTHDKGNGRGNLLFRNITDAMRNLGMQYITLWAQDSDMSPYYFARMGGRPKGSDGPKNDKWDHRTVNGIRMRATDFLMQEWENLPFGSGRRIAKNITKITPEHLAQNPTDLGLLASERHEIKGKPAGYHMLAFNSDYKSLGFAPGFLFDLKDERVLEAMYDYLNSKIADMRVDEAAPE